MKYEWKCNECGHVVTVTRPMDDRDIGPEGSEVECDHWPETYVRIMSVPNYDWEHMRDKGILQRLPF